jgi:leucyl/phenylalanyl-tRNA--protein transferase
MTSPSRSTVTITPQVLLKVYACGIFPMAESADDPGLFWIEPEVRGIIPLDGLVVSSRLARTVRSDRFRVTVDEDFDAVIEGCARSAPGRRTTWINTRIRNLYRELFHIGHCHTVEVYERDALVGGLYGVDLGAAFFGESMFHTATDASKVALVHLVARLRAGGYRLLDTQFTTPHLVSLGAIDVPRRRYQDVLEDALQDRGDFFAVPRGSALRGSEALRLALGEGVDP